MNDNTRIPVWITGDDDTTQTFRESPSEQSYVGDHIGAMELTITTVGQEPLEDSLRQLCSRFGFGAVAAALDALRIQ
jgi:hypothetical protein